VQDDKPIPHGKAIMNAILRNVCLALGALEAAGEAEQRIHSVQADDQLSRLPTHGAERPLRLALDRIGAVIHAIPEDQLISNRDLLLQLFDLGLKFEVFIGKIRKLPLPIDKRKAKVVDSLDQLDVLDLLRDIVKAFEPFNPSADVVNNPHNKFSVAAELLRQAQFNETHTLLDPSLPDNDVESPRHMRLMAEFLLLHG
jgi:hypothetical protein